MSIKLMSLVWDRQDFDPYERLVLLSLADHADDNGACYPSVSRLCARTGIKERKVQNVTKDLIKRGILEVEFQSGPRGTNLYRLHLDPRTACTPAPDAPRTRRRRPPHETTQTPAQCAHEPLRTVNEPSITPYSPPADFEAFWQIVPRKVGKGAARKAYGKALTKTDAGTLFSAMTRYAKERSGRDQQYTVHPSTWLNEERWDDEPPPSDGNFHDKISQLLSGGQNELQRQTSIDHGGVERLSPPISPPGTPGRTHDAGRAAQHGGGDQQAHLRLVQPRRFGGTR